MKKLVLLFITTLILGGLFAAPLNESFSDPTFPPSGWTVHNVDGGQAWIRNTSSTHYYSCLLYTSDAADDLLCVDLGGRRIIQKKNT